MIKFILKTVGFIILMCIALNYLSGIFKSPHRYMNTISDYKKILNDNKEIDIAIYGSSHAFCSFNPLYLDSITKTRSFNFGNDAQRLGVTNFVIDETQKKIKPKVIIIDMYSSSIKDPEGVKPLSFQKHSYDFFDFSFSKIKSAFEVFPVSDVAGVLFPVLRRNDFSLDTENMILSEDYKFKTNAVISEYRGFMGHPYTMKYSPAFNQNKFVDFNKVTPNKEKKITFSANEVENIYQSINKAKKQGAKVIVTVAPFLPALIDKNYINFHQFIKEICDKENVALVDFNLLANQLKLNFRDFRDGSHVNNIGSKKLSLFLGNYIKNNYSLASRENEKDWLEEQPMSMDNFIGNNFSKQSMPINKNLIENIELHAISYYSDGISKSIIVKTNPELTNEDLEKFKLGVYCFAHEEDKEQLTPYSKKSNKAYDGFNVNPVIKEIKGEKYIILKTTTLLNKFSKIKFFLFDNDGYKGVKGTAIELENIVLTQK